MADMTIKQIAEICQVEKRTVELWIQKCEKPSQICEKVSQAYKTKSPASFTLPETLAIIRAGGRSTLADLLQENANKSTDTALPQSTEVAQIMREMIPVMAVAVATAVKTALGQSSAPVRMRQAALALPASLPGRRILHHQGLWFPAWSTRQQHKRSNARTRGLQDFTAAQYRYSQSS